MYLNYYSLGEGPFTLFMLFNWVACVACLIWFIHTYVRRRYLFVKPSMMVLLVTHIFLQWPATIYSGFYEHYLPQSYDLLILLGGYVLIGLIVSTRTHVGLSKKIWDVVLHGGGGASGIENALMSLFAMIVVCLAIYFTAIPIMKTGLYAILFDPISSSIMREESLKLVESPVVTYSYSIMSGAIAPLFAGLVAVRLINAWSAGERAIVFVCAAGIVFSMAAVSITGARYAVMKIVLIVLLVPMLRRGLPFKPLHVLALVFVVLLPAVLISMMRESRVPSYDLLAEYFGFIFYRIVSTLEVGVWYVHSAQTNGLWGLGGIAKLAYLFGEQVLDIPNIIGQLYAEYFTDTMSATAGYVFTYYSFFGMPSLLISLILLWALDVALYVLVKLAPDLLLASLATLFAISLSFIQSDYTTTLVTHGYLVVVVISYLIARTFMPARRPLLCE